MVDRFPVRHPSFKPEDGGSRDGFAAHTVVEREFLCIPGEVYFCPLVDLLMLLIVVHTEVHYDRDP